MLFFRSREFVLRFARSECGAGLGSRGGVVVRVRSSTGDSFFGFF